MIKANVAVLDSGVGGLNVLSALNEKLSSTRFFYLGDNDNAPYGNRTLLNLWDITLTNLLYLNTFKLDALVLGCNTLSVNLLTEIEDFMGIKTFGVFPPVEGAIMSGERTLLLSTVSTARKYKKTNHLCPLGLPNLAKDIENNIYSLDRIRLESHFYHADLEKTAFQRVILGCTHYEIIKNRIFDHLKPQKIFCGTDFTVLNLKNFLERYKKVEFSYQNEIIFVGKNAEKNKKIYNEVVKNI